MAVLLRAAAALALAAGAWWSLGLPRTATAKAATASDPTAPPSIALRAPALDERAVAVDPALVPDPPPPMPRLNPGDDAERAWLLATGPSHAPNDGRRLVTFTFDDGPSPDTTPGLLKVLEEHHVRAAFFFIGEYLTGDGGRAAESRAWARRVAEAGHVVGNHTFDHRRLTSLSHAAALAEIDDAAAAIEAATGERPWLFRPPFGALDGWLEQTLSDRGLDLALWSIDANDVRNVDPDETARRVEEQLVARGGGVVLLHDVHKASVAAFERIVTWIEARAYRPDHPDQKGWDVVDFPTYMRATGASPPRDAAARRHVPVAPVISSQMAAALPESVLPSILTSQKSPSRSASM